jgi:hypothetical protein
MEIYKRAIENACIDKGYTLDYISLDDNIESIQEKFKKAVGYICIFAHSYGYQPNGFDKPSLIEIECNIALDTQTPILSLVMDEKIPCEIRDIGIRKEMLLLLLSKLAHHVREPFTYQSNTEVYHIIFKNLDNLQKYYPMIVNVLENNNPLFGKNNNYDTIFISYKREDWHDYAFTIASKLIDIGIPVWIDQKVLNIGMWWMQEIQSALAKCEHMILCVSPEALNSRYVTMEYTYFIDKNKPLYPIICRPTQLPPLLNGIQSGNFSDLDNIINIIKTKAIKK